MSHHIVSEEGFRINARKIIRTTSDPLEKLRLALLVRGTTGILAFSRLFRVLDDNETGTITLDEFKKGCLEQTREEINDEDISKLFAAFDKDGTGAIDFKEFINALRPPMSFRREKLINAAFAKMDKSGNGIVDAADMKGVFDATKHPKFLSGESTQEQVCDMFLANFELPGKVDGKVTREEFLNYYAGVSALIDNDTYFDLMMRQAWKL